MGTGLITMRSCALVGRLFLLLCFAELAKTACTTNTQPALTACPTGFYTSDTTTSCTECVNNQAQIRECGCEDTSSSCNGVYMKFYFSAEEKNNCTSSSSNYLSVSTAAYSKYLTFRENQMAGFWTRGHVKPDGSDVSTELGKVLQLTRQNHLQRYHGSHNQATYQLTCRRTLTMGLQSCFLTSQHASTSLW